MGVRPSIRILFAAVVLSAVSFSSPASRGESTQAASEKKIIEDTWQGTLHAGRDLRTVVKISKAPDGALKAVFYSIDQNPQPLPVKTTTFQDGELRLGIEEIDGTYIGKMSADGSTITGEWKQGDRPLPLILARATPDTAWAIPEPPKPMPPMAADAKPTWDVATIKPAPPDEKGKGFGGPPRHFRTGNTTLNDLIMFAYDVNSKQIAGGPAWMETDKFDIITGEPDLPDSPNQKQVKAMLRNLMEQRFGMKFHTEKRDMQAYVLSVAKSGPKMVKNESGDHQGSSFYFTKLGNLIFRDDTMDDFCSGMQGAVFDRPVVNHTGLEGYWNGTLKWTPDETQFTVFNAKIVPNDAADAPPPIFTAIQEQIGLKLEAQKTAVSVMVLDHVEKPSEN